MHGVCALLIILTSVSFTNARKSCQQELIQVAISLDRQDTSGVAGELERLARFNNCEISGYWWLLRGWLTHLIGGDGTADWGLAEDLYGSGPVAAPPGVLEQVVSSNSIDIFDFAGVFGFPIYSRSYDPESVFPLHEALEKQARRKGWTREIRTSGLSSFRLRQHEQLEALAAVSVADFATKSIKSDYEKHHELMSITSRLQVAISEVRAAPSAKAASRGASKSRGLGPFLTGLYLLHGRGCVCFQQRFPNGFYDPSGEIDDRSVVFNASAGSLFLFHHSVLLSTCNTNASELFDNPLWVAFDAWVQSPLAEEGGMQEGALKFVDASKSKEKVAAALRIAPEGVRRELWPVSARVVKFHYPSDNGFDAAGLIPVSWHSLSWPLSQGVWGDPLWCPEGHPSALERPELEALRSALLSVSKEFIKNVSKHDGSELTILSSSLCRLSGDLRVRLQFPLPSRGLLRGGYVVQSALPDVAGQPLQARLETTPASFGLGVHLDGIATSLAWPFAPQPWPLNPRLPPGSVFLLPAPAQLAVLPYTGDSESRLLLFDVGYNEKDKVGPSADASNSHETFAGVVDNLNEHIAHLFGTAIFSQHTAGLKKLNGRLRKAVLEAAKSMPSAQISNIGGWQSEPDWLMTATDPSLSELRDQLVDAVFTMLCSELQPKAVAKLDLRITGWANLNRQNHSNALHHHSDSDWRLSGAYVVSTGGNTSLLQFWDPRQITSYHEAGVLWRALEREPLPSVKVDAGTLLLFPSWLEHSVPPHRGTQPRITISFNIAAYWRTDASNAHLQHYPKVWSTGKSASSGLHVTRARHNLWTSVVATQHGSNIALAAADKLYEIVRQKPDRALSSMMNTKCSQWKSMLPSAEPCNEAVCVSVVLESMQLFCSEVLHLARRVFNDACETCANNPVSLDARGYRISELPGNHRESEQSTFLLPAAGHRAILHSLILLAKDSNQTDVNTSAKVHFHDPRAMGRNFEHLRRHATQTDVQLLGAGSIVVYPPWLRAEVEIFYRSHQDLAFLWAFDVYADSWKLFDA